MKEDLLHYIWKHKKLLLGQLVGTQGESISILDTGTHNHLTGPDFFNAKIKIDDQLWAGNVEIHLNASDWYAHRHEEDANYNNVILHVVWQDDATVFRKDRSKITTLELKGYVPEKLLMSYRDLMDKQGVRFINCERHIGQLDAFLLENWMDRLYFERLERKSRQVSELLQASKNDWEQTFFKLLLKSFGLKINGEAFMSLGETLQFSTVQKISGDRFQMESLLFGMSHLLEGEDVVDEYYLQLQKEFGHLKGKYDLDASGVIKPEFFKLRPANFPTLRLSQLANLYAERQNLFSQVINASGIDAIYAIFEVSASPYWNDHYTFGKTSKRSTKKLTKKFIDLLIINTLLPLKFCYARYYGKESDEEIVRIISEIKSEQNSIIGNFKDCGLSIRDARQSQAAIQLYNEYCVVNRCLQCAVGNRLLQGNG